MDSPLSRWNFNSNSFNQSPTGGALEKSPRLGSNKKFLGKVYMSLEGKTLDMSKAENFGDTYKMRQTKNRLLSPNSNSHKLSQKLTILTPRKEMTKSVEYSSIKSLTPANVLKSYEAAFKDSSPFGQSSSSVKRIHSPSKNELSKKFFKNFNTALKSSETPKATNISVESAIKKMQDNSLWKWLKKRGKKKNEEDINKNILELIFSQLDIEKSGKVKAEELLKSLLMLGIASDPELLRSCVCIIAKKDALNNEYLSLKDFQSLFRGDVWTDKILDILNDYSIIEKHKTRIFHDESIFGMNSEPTIFQSRRASSKLINKIREKIKEEKWKEDSMTTMNDHQNLIQLWWSDIDPKKGSSIHINMVIKKLVELNFADDIESGQRLIKHFLNVESHLNFNDFQKIFAKSMLKGSFVNLSKRIFNDKKHEIDNFQTLSSYKRNVIMTGIRIPNEEITIEEGMSALQALEKYQMNAEGKSKLTSEEAQENIIKLIRIYYQMTQQNYKSTEKLLKAEGKETDNPFVIFSPENQNSSDAIEGNLMQTEINQSKFKRKKALNVVSGNYGSRSSTPSIGLKVKTIRIPTDIEYNEQNETQDWSKHKVLDTNFIVNKYKKQEWRGSSVPKRRIIKSYEKLYTSKLQNCRDINKQVLLSSELLNSSKI